MSFIKVILDSPLYTLLFGSGGILIIIISIWGLIKKSKVKKKDKQNSTVFENENDANDPTKQEVASFVAELTINSPVEDSIKLEQIEPNERNYF